MTAVEWFRGSSAEFLFEGSQKTFATRPPVIIGDLKYRRRVQLPDLAGVIQNLCNDVARRFITLQFDNGNCPICADTQKINSSAVGSANLSANEQYLGA